MKTRQDIDKWLSQRDSYFAGVVEKQIYEKGVKGLIIIGSEHLRRTDNLGTGSTVKALPTGSVQTPMVDNQGRPALMGTANPGSEIKPPVQVNVKTMLQMIEEKHPHTVYVIVVHTGFGSLNKELEPKLQSWPVPSIASIKGTWIGALDRSYDSLGSALFGPGSKSTHPLSGRKKEADIDGYLYLGPVESFTITQPSPGVYKNDTYFNELNRRHLLTVGTPLNRQDLLKEKPTNFLENYQQGGESYP